MSQQTLLERGTGKQGKGNQLLIETLGALLMDRVRLGH